MTRDLDTEKQRYVIQEVPGFKPSYLIYDAATGVWFKTQLGKRTLWVWGPDYASRIPTWKEAQSIVQHLEDVAEKAIQKAARTMNPVVEEAIRVAKVAVVALFALVIGRSLVQVIWGM